MYIYTTTLFEEQILKAIWLLPRVSLLHVMALLRPYISK
jgi:hypothetical protein